MKIGVDARFLGGQSAGLERYTGELIRDILEIDHKNKYVIFVKKISNLKSQISKLQLKTKNYKIIEIDVPHYSIKEQLILPWILYKYKLDLVHFTHFNHPLLYFKPFVINILDLTLLRHPARKSNWLKKMAMKIVLRSAAWRAKKIITISEWVKRDIAKTYGVPQSKIAVTYPGVKLLSCHSRESGNPDINLDSVSDCFASVRNDNRVLNKYHIQKPYLLYVGQWRTHKNLLRLVEAFSLIKKGFPELKLVFAGKKDPLHPELPLKVKELRLEKDVIYTDYVDDEDLPVIYANAEVFVFPSLSEGFGLPVLEAMAAGVPVVCSNATSLPEVGGQAALYFDPKNTEKMAEKIIKVLENKKLQSKMIELGKEQIKKFSWENMAKRTFEIYNQI